MLNLASFGPDEHQLLIQAGIEGLRDILELCRSTTFTGAAPARPPTELERGAADRPHDRGLVGPGEDARGGVASRRASSRRTGYDGP